MNVTTLAWAYYNEFDPDKAAWLRELIKAGTIADGEVDERSIADVHPGDLVRFTQCHFFAGIGIWSHALRLAGIPDGQPVWTFSCPCQPFSAAGKKAGFADRRHLWPDMFRLIRGGRPVLCFGEQVSSPDGLTWLDAVCADMESEAYTLGAVDLCAAGAGGPHIRNRTFFVAYAKGGGFGEFGDASLAGRGGYSDGGIESCGMAQPEHTIGRPEHKEHSKAYGRAGSRRNGSAGLMGNPNEERPQGRIIGRNGTNECAAGEAGVVSGMGDSEGSDGRLPVFKRGSLQDSPQSGGASGPCNGFRADARWIYCRDDAWRPAQPSPLAMADGVAADLGSLRLPGGEEVIFPLIQKGKRRTQRLRGYGDGIVAPVAAEFIRCAMESI